MRRKTGSRQHLEVGTRARGIAGCETVLRLKSCILCSGSAALKYCSLRVVLHDKAKGDQRQ